MYWIYSKLLNLESLQLRKRNADAFVLIISELLSLRTHKDLVITCVIQFKCLEPNYCQTPPPHTGPWGYCQYVNSLLATQRVGHGFDHCSKFLGFFLPSFAEEQKIRVVIVVPENVSYLKWNHLRPLPTCATQLGVLYKWLYWSLIC